jgi:hypothetical protein
MTNGHGKAIAIIPDFVVPTANARNVLPQSYSREDVVCECSILHGEEDHIRIRRGTSQGRREECSALEIEDLAGNP